MITFIKSLLPCSITLMAVGTSTKNFSSSDPYWPCWDTQYLPNKPLQTFWGSLGSLFIGFSSIDESLSAEKPLLLSNTTLPVVLFIIHVIIALLRIEKWLLVFLLFSVVLSSWTLYLSPSLPLFIIYHLITHSKWELPIPAQKDTTQAFPGGNNCSDSTKPIL